MEAQVEADVDNVSFDISFTALFRKNEDVDDVSFLENAATISTAMLAKSFQPPTTLAATATPHKQQQTNEDSKARLRGNPSSTLLTRINAIS